jgi:hypothetical protein
MKVLARSSHWVIAVSILVSCLALGLMFGQPSQGEVPSTSSGRYQFAVAGERGNAVYVFEPSTGQCWYRETNPAIKSWTDMGSPTLRSRVGGDAVEAELQP